MKDIFERLKSGKPIHIKRGVWIGANATILPGITIGEGAVVGSGSMVTHDVAPNTVVAGNHAKAVKTISCETN